MKGTQEGTDRKNIILTFDGVTFSYPGVEVLSGTSFHLHEGEFVALVGPNGAGKSTILRLILGLERPEKGVVTLYGKQVEESRELIGYVPQYTKYDFSFPISVREVVRMGRIRKWQRAYGSEDREEVERALNLMDISNLAQRPFNALSGGQRRRVLVARALAGNPSLLLLDEPTANMDARSEKNFYQALERVKGDITILIVTHDTSYVSVLTDRVLCAGEESREGHIGKVVQHPLTIVDDGLGHQQRAKILHTEQIAHSCEHLGGENHE